MDPLPQIQQGQNVAELLQGVPGPVNPRLGQVSVFHEACQACHNFFLE